MTPQANPSPVTLAHQEQFQRDGFFILEWGVPEEHLALLRAEVASARARIDAQTETQGVEKSEGVIAVPVEVFHLSDVV